MRRLPTSAPDSRFALACLALAAAAALSAGLAPVGFAAAIVFLFAGPHNWIELRYFLSKAPSRLGPLRTFFFAGLSGAAVLTVAYIAFALALRSGALDEGSARLAQALWGTGVVGWAGALALVKGSSLPARFRPYIAPSALALTAWIWLSPGWFSFALAYLHPLVGLFILDRELRRRPEWRASYRVCLSFVPVFILGIWCLSPLSSPAYAESALSRQIAAGAGASMLPSFPGPLLIATHAFLEMLHYGVWLLGIPLVTGMVSRLSLVRLPCEKRSLVWKVIAATATAVAGVLVLSLWVGFSIDYPTARELYFAIAMSHMLAEVPFVLRLS